MRISDWSSDVCSSDLAPMGAYDVLAKLNEDGRRAAPMTVYRAIDFLMEQGLVHRLASRNAFVGCENPDAPHSGQFLICKRCGRVAELDEGDIGKAIVRGAARAGFAVAITVVEVEGFCPYRLEERRGGKECGRSCRSRGWGVLKKKKQSD